MFFAIGFETTAPSTALTLLRARELGLENFFVFCNHILVLPAVRALLEMPDMRLQAFIGPGHVSTVIGCRGYQFIAEEFGCPIVISGFEPIDLLQSIVMILRQIREGRVEVENQYGRAVSWDGNLAAQRAMTEVFEHRPEFEWRGLGMIPDSAVRLREEFSSFDAERHLEHVAARIEDPPEAQCGEVLKGSLKPCECGLFGKECTPEHPIGALMVSSEGAALRSSNMPTSPSAPIFPAAGHAFRAIHVQKRVRRQADLDVARRGRSGHAPSDRRTLRAAPEQSAARSNGRRRGVRFDRARPARDDHRQLCRPADRLSRRLRSGNSPSTAR